MKRIDNNTATVTNQFTDGDPSVPTPATTVDSVWLNNVQEEIANVVEEAGDTLDQTGATTDQLKDAILSLILANASSQEFASNAESNTGTATDKALTPNNFGSQQSKLTNGYFYLPGGLIVQFFEGSTRTVEGTVSATFPIAFPNAVLSVGVSTKASVFGTSGNSIWQVEDDATLTGVTLILQGLNSTSGVTFTPVVIAIGY